MPRPKTRSTEALGKAPPSAEPGEGSAIACAYGTWAAGGVIAGIAAPHARPLSATAASVAAGDGRPMLGEETAAAIPAAIPGAPAPPSSEHDDSRGGGREATCAGCERARAPRRG